MSYIKCEKGKDYFWGNIDEVGFQKVAFWLVEEFGYHFENLLSTMSSGYSMSIGRGWQVIFYNFIVNRSANR